MVLLNQSDPLLLLSRGKGVGDPICFTHKADAAAASRPNTITIVNSKQGLKNNDREHIRLGEPDETP